MKMSIYTFLIIFVVIGNAITQRMENSITKNKSVVCPFYNVIQVPEIHQGRMGNLWIVTKIIPKGNSLYSDGSTACGLNNFSRSRCKCLRYSLTVDENGSIIRKAAGLEKSSNTFRYMEDRLVFIENYIDVFQGQLLKSAIVDFEGVNFKVTDFPNYEESLSEYMPFALIGTDNYENWAVYATCSITSPGPLVWVAFTNNAFISGKSEDFLPEIYKILSSNNINPRKLVTVDQQDCRP